MEKENKFIQMVLTMMENGKMTNMMAKESKLWKMAKSILVLIKIIESMERVKNFMEMDL